MTDRNDASSQLDKLSEKLDVMSREIGTLAWVDDVFWNVQALRRENADRAGRSDSLQEWMVHCYVHSTAIGLRRLADPNTGSHSMVKLLNSMNTHRRHLTRERYVQLCEPLPPSMATRQFVDLCDGSNCDSVPHTALAKRLEMIAAVHEQVRPYCNSYVAHRRLRPATDSIQFKNLRESLVRCWFVLGWCSLILRATSLAGVEPSRNDSLSRALGLPRRAAKYVTLTEMANTMRADEAAGGPGEGCSDG